MGMSFEVAVLGSIATPGTPAPPAARRPGTPPDLQCLTSSLQLRTANFQAPTPHFKPSDLEFPSDIPPPRVAFPVIF